MNASGHLIEMKGLVFDIIHELSRSLNFTYTVLISERKSNTSVYSEDDMAESLTSSIPEAVTNMVQRKMIAISACAFTITPKAKEIINFTMPISTQTYTFLVARPKELSRALLFMSPFSGYVSLFIFIIIIATKLNFQAWLSIAGVLVLMGPILYAMDRLSPVYRYKGISIKGGLSSIENCIWYMYGALLQQGNY